jgi:putative FmdB family regulatory protein
MPLYEYDCPKCGRFEVLQKMSDKPLQKHDCGRKVTKVLSASAFAFKGSGFYITDYKSSGSSSSSDKKSSKSEKSEGSSSSEKPSSSDKPKGSTGKAA